MIAETGATILIIDDLAENLLVLSELLQSQYRVLAVTSGESGLRAANRLPKPDLILLDVMMPGMDGYAVLARLRENQDTHDIPVVFLTALSAAGDEERGLQLGATDYITKPIQPTLVLARVRTQLEAKQARDWLTNQNAALETEVDRRMTELKKMEQERIDHLKRLGEASRHLVSVQEDARRRLSGELHDRTSPNLAAISINLDIIATELPQEHSTDLAERIEDTRALILDTTASIREICADLRPPLLDYAGMAAALEGYVQQFAKRTGIEVKCDCANHNIRLAPDLESMLFRITQEALTNCAKHAHATSVTVSLHHGSRPIVLTVTDNGVGFDPERLGKIGRIGLGLLNMREMAEVAGGSYTIESSPGKGTRIAVEIP